MRDKERRVGEREKWDGKTDRVGERKNRTETGEGSGGEKGWG